MKIFSLFQDYIDKIKNYLEAEKELIRLKVVRAASQAAANLISIIFVIILFNIMLAMAGIWLGFYLSEILHSYSMGFGVSALIFVFLLLLMIAFRKPLLVKPFTNLAVGALAKDRKEKDEDQKS